MCIYKREIEFYSLKKKDEDFREYYRKKYNEVFAKWSALKKARSPWRRLFKKPGIIKE